MNEKRTIPRSILIESKLEKFLNSSAPYFTISLYSREGKKFSRDYNDTLVFEKGPKTLATLEDKRYFYVISKK